MGKYCKWVWPHFGKNIEDPCYGSCIRRLGTEKLITITNNALKDLESFPNWGIPGTKNIVFGFPGTKKSLELSDGNSALGTAIDLWDCNNLVSQAWDWNDGAMVGNHRDYSIKLAGHNVAGQGVTGLCIDLPGGNVANGNPLWIWGCNGGDHQQWLYDSTTHNFRYKANQSYCIDVPAGNTANGNHLWLWECSGTSSQVWNVVHSMGAATGSATQIGSGVHAPLSNSSQDGTNKRPGGMSWMHEVKKWLATACSNFTYPADWVHWYETKEVKDWYAAQRPGPGLPRHMVPEGWNGYSSTRPLASPTHEGTDVGKFNLVLV